MCSATLDPRRLDGPTKCAHMAQLDAYRRDVLWTNPPLRNLFFELTLDCNEHCLHCGSRCGDEHLRDQLTLDDYKRILDEVARDFGTRITRLCITGGEPLLRKDFFEIMEYAHSLGFDWGMTTNGTLVTPEIARRLYAAGMSTVSVSVDGLEETHEWFRQSKGSYARALAGVRALIDAADGKHVQITTCVHQRNFGQLDAMRAEFSALGITSWRVFNVEPIGRAKDNAHILLNDDQLRQLIDYVRDARLQEGPEVQYSCSHYLGVELEYATRPWYFLCSAGLYVGSIAANGDILACLDIERRPDLVQGNIRHDRLLDVWRDKFEIFRSDWRHTGPCANCEHYPVCCGDSFHTWDFDAMEPSLCLKDIVF